MTQALGPAALLVWQLLDYEENGRFWKTCELTKWGNEEGIRSSASHLPIKPHPSWVGELSLQPKLHPALQAGPTGWQELVVLTALS